MTQKFTIYVSANTKCNFFFSSWCWIATKWNFTLNLAKVRYFIREIFHIKSHNLVAGWRSFIIIPLPSTLFPDTHDYTIKPKSYNTTNTTRALQYNLILNSAYILTSIFLTFASQSWNLHFLVEFWFKVHRIRIQ